MASGGSIPSNRTQAVTFYNTTGLIEKEKGIYLSPRFKNRTTDIGREVRAVYLDILNAVAVKDPDYEGIVVSSWSPQDRDLTVKGNIDDFRLVTDEGDCLNYLIITRNVTKGNVTNTYYYGFFITDVKQAGGASIRLTVEPDDLTNIFYLHNKHILTSYEIETSDYDPFNERMKNCYVQRQHYDRVYKQLGGYWLLSINLTDISMSEGEIKIGDDVELLLEDSQATDILGTVNYVDDRNLAQHELYLIIKTSQKSEIGEAQNFSVLHHDGNSYQCDYDFGSIEWERIANVLPANRNIFLNQDESFKFKYQFRDKKIPFALGDIFTDSELVTIENSSSFDNLSDELKEKVLKASIQYLVVELKSQELIGPVYDMYQEQGRTYQFRNYIEGLFRYGPVLFVPLINVPDVFSKFNSAIKLFSFQFRIKDSEAITDSSDATDVYEYINKNALADFIFSAYIVNDMAIPESFYEFDLENKKIRFICNNGRGDSQHPVDPKESDLFVVPIKKDRTSTVNVSISYNYANMEDDLANIPSSVTVLENAFNMFMLSGYNSREITINFSESIPNLKNNFYDPVLEAEPYSFYSISYLSYELPFNKNRYYETDSIVIDYYFSINGAVKIGFIPHYTVSSKTYKYFNEGLVFTLPSSLPLVSDSYASYYYQNQAQMKNQFAVNDYNKGVDLAQHFFIGGPNKVGNQAFKRGGYGAIAETVFQVGEMIDEAIDWAQSTKNIEMNQQAKLADMGAKPDVVKQTGSDVFYDLVNYENRLYLNHYTIDSLSYYSISKLFERIGYQIKLYSTMNVNNRVGWNYVKLVSFDWNPAYDIMVGQEENLRKIFSEGVTLLHDKSYLTSGHNYETILDE